MAKRPVVITPVPNETVIVNSTIASTVGPQGPAGATGPAGAAGPAGASGGSFTFAQSTPASVWSVTHNLGYFPAVTTTDISGSNIVGDVAYVNSNALTITFSGVIGGYAYMS